MASAWKYGNTMKADIKKTINKIIFTQATTFSKALIKKLNTTPWGRSVKQVQWESESDSVGLDPNAETADVHWYSRNMEKTTFCCDDRRHIHILLHKSNMTVLISGFSVSKWKKKICRRTILIPFVGRCDDFMFWTTRDSLVNRQEAAAAPSVRAGRPRRLANISVTRHLKVGSKLLTGLNPAHVSMATVCSWIHSWMFDVLRKNSIITETLLIYRSRPN